MPALTQLEQGERLLQRTLRRRQVTQLRALAISEAGRGAVTDTPVSALGEFSLAGDEFSPSREAVWNDMTQHRSRPSYPHVLGSAAFGSLDDTIGVVESNFVTFEGVRIQKGPSPRPDVAS